MVSRISVGEGEVSVPHVPWKSWFYVYFSFCLNVIREVICTKVPNTGFTLERDPRINLEGFVRDLKRGEDLEVSFWGKRENEDYIVESGSFHLINLKSFQGSVSVCLFLVERVDEVPKFYQQGLYDILVMEVFPLFDGNVVIQVLDESHWHLTDTNHVSVLVYRTVY